MTAELASAPAAPCQLWLDVDRPILMKPLRKRVSARSTDLTVLEDQMELSMAPAGHRSALPRRAVAFVEADPLNGSAEPFGAWLVQQAQSRSGWIAEPPSHARSAMTRAQPAVSPKRAISS